MINPSTDYGRARSKRVEDKMNNNEVLQQMEKDAGLILSELRGGLRTLSECVGQQVVWKIGARTYSGTLQVSEGVYNIGSTLVCSIGLEGNRRVNQEGNLVEISGGLQ